jgi:predicted TIM-barrel fold metal-dependent hydrolase
MGVSFDDLGKVYKDRGVGGLSGGLERKSVTFLPEPTRRERYFTVISVDDHLVEPPHTFEGRMPSKFKDRAPTVVDTEDGGQAWLYDGKLLPNVGLNAVVGRAPDERSFEPMRFDEMRRGTWDIHARIHDMNLDGVYASLGFPSFLAGFGGGRLQTVSKDLELGLAAVRAWNQFHIEEWAGTYPDRIIPCQIPWLHDPELGAEEIRRNAALGFHAVTFPEALSNFGFPSIHTRHWDPIIAACEETETVICVHVGSAGSIPATTPDAPPDVPAILFGGYAMMTTVDWLYSLYAVRFPKIKIAMSEGGIGWVAGLMDRLVHCERSTEKFGTWWGLDISAHDALRRNFWFCAVDDPTAYKVRDRIGVDKICYEVDYPHTDTSWPNTQELLRAQLAGVPAEDAARITWQNASELYRHPVPKAIQDDPNAF